MLGILPPMVEAGGAGGQPFGAPTPRLTFIGREVVILPKSAGRRGVSATPEKSADFRSCAGGTHGRASRPWHPRTFVRSPAYAPRTMHRTCLVREAHAQLPDEVVALVVVHDLGAVG